MRLQCPQGVSAVSVAGIAYQADENGTILLPNAELAATILKRFRGFAAAKADDFSPGQVIEPVYPFAAAAPAATQAAPASETVTEPAAATETGAAVTEIVTEPAAANEIAKPDFAAMTVPQLSAFLMGKGATIAPGAKKADLVKLAEALG